MRGVFATKCICIPRAEQERVATIPRDYTNFWKVAVDITGGVLHILIILCLRVNVQYKSIATYPSHLIFQYLIFLKALPGTSNGIQPFPTPAPICHFSRFFDFSGRLSRSKWASKMPAFKLAAICHDSLSLEVLRLFYHYKEDVPTRRLAGVIPIESTSKMYIPPIHARSRTGLTRSSTIKVCQLSPTE